jgi:hypothetical protein
LTGLERRGNHEGWNFGRMIAPFFFLPEEEGLTITLQKKIRRKSKYVPHTKYDRSIKKLKNSHNDKTQKDNLEKH